VAERLEPALKKLRETGAGDPAGEEEYARLVEEIEDKCLKKTRHFAPKDAIYETPSDYDPLALNMGQMVVYRFSVRSRLSSCPPAIQC
jgi:hypothetical protein